MSLLLKDTQLSDKLKIMKRLFGIFSIIALMCCETAPNAKLLTSGGILEQNSANRFTLRLRCNQKLVNASYDHYNGTSYLTRGMKAEESPETYTFSTSADGNVYVYVFVESRCTPEPTNNCATAH